MAQHELLRGSTGREPGVLACRTARDANPQPSGSLGLVGPASQPNEIEQAVKPNRVLIILLGVALATMGLLLAAAIHRNTVLTNQVSVLEADVARATAVVEAHRARSERVREEVGDLLTRIAVLDTLLQSEVVPASSESDAIESSGSLTPAK